MPQSFCRNFAVTGFALCAAAAGVCLALGLWLWALGILVGGAWLFLNLTLLIRLMTMTFDAKVRRKDRVLFYSVLKFPVLYIAGFFILKSRTFPVYSVLIGLTLFMAAFAAGWIAMNARENGAVGKAGAV